MSLTSPALTGGFFTTCTTWEGYGTQVELLGTKVCKCSTLQDNTKLCSQSGYFFILLKTIYTRSLFHSISTTWYELNVKFLPTECVQLLSVKNLPANAGTTGDVGSTWVGKIFWRRKWQLQYSCLHNLMAKGVWWATVHRVTRVGHDWATEHSTQFYLSMVLIL